MREKPFYLPQVRSTVDEASMPQTAQRQKTDYPCPCCGCLTFPVPREEAVAFICPVCYWENDVFITDDEESSDENHGMTLEQARKNYQEIGACSLDLLKYVRRPRPEEILNTNK